jgi:hypothetical protein
MKRFVPIRWLNGAASAAALVLLASCGDGGSSTPATTSVPNAVGQTQAAAMVAITAAGLTVGMVTMQSNGTVASGDVLSESPAGGTKAMSGSAVNLVVSTGPVVPNVVGQTQGAATAAITAAGLTVGTVTVQSSGTVASGDVVSESPAAGTNAMTGSAVNLVVSTGGTALLSIITGALPSGVIGTTYNQTIQAMGGVSPFTWTVSTGALPHNLSLNPSTANMVTISGTPDTSSQGVAFTIQVSDSAHHTAAQPYTVSILLQADSLVLSPPSGLDFGNQIVGSASGALTETLTNTATADMVISSIAINTWNQPSNPGEFTQSSTTCGSTLAAGASCAINLTFTPGQTGPRAAVLTITDDTAGSPQSVGLGGVGMSTGPNATLSTESLPFLGTELVGTTSPARTLSLSNYGTAALSIGTVSATASFAETNNCIGSLPSLGSCTISVTFTPGGSGDVTGTLSISDDAAGAPQKVTLSGTGSTSTPPLNGICVTSCGSATDTAQCPVGQPSENPVPVSLGRVCGVGPGGGFAVLDEARSCAALIRGRRFTGVCEAQ